MGFVGGKEEGRLGGGLWSGMGAGGKVTTVKKLISRIRIDFTLV